MNIDKKALKGFVDEIEASRTRQKGETEFQREVFKKIKGANLDAKAVRIVLQRRAMGDTKRDEQDYYVHAYELALGGKKDALEALERGASTREAAKIGGISNGAAAALAKGAQKSPFVSGPPHDPETGAVHEADRSIAPEGRDAAAMGTGRSDGGGAKDAAGGVLVDDGSRGGQAGPSADAGPGAERPEPGAGRPTEDADQVRVAPGPQDPKPDLFQRITGSFRPLARDDDDLKIPAFLRRTA